MNEEYKPITNLWKDSKGYRYFGMLKLSSKIKYDGDDFIPLWEWVEQLQQENKQLKIINKEYERLNKENARSFKITSVQEYDIYELLSYKSYKYNWNKLKEYLHNQIPTDKTVLTKHIKIFEVLDKMQELEQGSDSKC